jgi:hypothetical protein
MFTAENGASRGAASVAIYCELVWKIIFFIQSRECIGTSL